MNEPRAQQIIILCTFITIGSTSAAEMKGVKKAAKLHPSKTIIGGFFAMLGCSIIAEISPSTGAYLAILVSGTAFFTYGLPAIESAKWFEGEAGATGKGSPIGHPGKKIVGTQIVRNRAGGPVEVPIYEPR